MLSHNTTQPNTTLSIKAFSMLVTHKLSVVTYSLVFKESGAECHLTLQEIIMHTQGILRLVWYEKDIDLSESAADHS